MRGTQQAILAKVDGTAIPVDERSVDDMAADLGLRTDDLWAHLAELEEAGLLVRQEARGRS
ncbi:MAG: hypothetical protein U5R31_09810 [Acidimicrobiia bacterium]|nr:hypothetical protein [Acidimicrobiia bacterium]